MPNQQVRDLAHFSPRFDWQAFVAQTKGVAPDEPLIMGLWQLVQPQASWREGRITQRDHLHVVIDDGDMVIESAYVAKGLQECQRVSVMALTIGAELPRAVSEWMTGGELYKGTVGDLLGSYGVELLADEFCRYLSQQALVKGLYGTLRFSPGYGDWPLEGQRQLMAYLASPRLAVQLSTNCMLEPVKSITALIGWSGTWQQPQYPNGVKGSGFCNGGHNCAACVTWACQKGRR